MLRALPEQDLINAVIGNVKLAGAGLLKMEMKEKQDKKMKRKEQDKKKDTKEITEWWWRLASHVYLLSKNLSNKMK